MLEAYKKLIIVYYVIGVLGALCFLVPAIFDGNWFLDILYAVLWITGCWLVLVITTTTLEQKKGQLLSNCKPAQFVAHKEIVYPTITD